MVSNLKIGTRLSLGFILIFLLLTSITFFGINRMDMLSKQTGLIYNHPLTVSNAVLRINTNLIKMHRSMKDIALAQDTESIKKDSKIVDYLEKEIFKDFQIIDDRFLGEKEKYELALLEFTEWKPIRDEVISFMQEGKKRRAADITRGKGARHVVRIEKAMEGLGDFAENKAKDFLHSTEIMRINAFNVMYLLITVSIIMSILLAFLLARTITQPLSNFRIATDKIGRGLLDTKIEINSRDEIGELADSFNKMTTDLKKITASRDELDKEILERIKAENELALANVELERKNRELEQILYITSHDLRSPLVNIQGYSDELANILKDMITELKNEEITDELKERINTTFEKNIKDAFDFIQASSLKMDSLLTGLLQFSRSGRAELKKEELDVGELVNKVIKTFDYKINTEDITLEIHELPDCYGDEKQMNQMFSNLIANAIKYLAPNRPGIVKVSGHKEDGHNIYCVEDNGIGINSFHYDKIFNIFNQLNPSMGGEGLGLSIVSRIVERHNGKIWIESVEGKGSKFYVSLPNS